MNFGYQSPFKTLVSSGSALRDKGQKSRDIPSNPPKSQPNPRSGLKGAIGLASTLASNPISAIREELKPVGQRIASPRAPKPQSRPKLITSHQGTKLTTSPISGIGKFSPRAAAPKTPASPKVVQSSVSKDQQIEVEDISLNASAESIKGHTLFNDESLDNGRLLLETICESDSKKTTYSRSPSALTPKLARIYSSQGHVRPQQHSHSPNIKGARYLVNAEYDEPQNRGRMNHTSDKRSLRQGLREKEALSLQNSQTSLISAIKEPGNDFIFSRKLSQQKIGSKNTMGEPSLPSTRLESTLFAQKPKLTKLKMIDKIAPQAITQRQYQSELFQNFPVMSPIWYSATGSQVVERHSLQVPMWSSVHENMNPTQPANYMTAEQLLPDSSVPVFAVPAPRQELNFAPTTSSSQAYSVAQKQHKTTQIDGSNDKDPARQQSNFEPPNRKGSKPGLTPPVVFPTSKHSTHDLVNMLLKSTSIQSLPMHGQGGQPSMSGLHMMRTPEKQNQVERQKVPRNSGRKIEFPEKISNLVSQPAKTDKYFEFFDFGVKKEIKRINHDIDTLIRRASEPSEIPQKFASCLSLQPSVHGQTTTPPPTFQTPSKPRPSAAVPDPKPTQTKKPVPSKYAATASEYFDARKYLASKSTVFGQKSPSVTKIGASMATGLQNNTSKTSVMSSTHSVKSHAVGASDPTRDQQRSTKVLADKFLSKLIKKYEKKPQESTPEGNKDPKSIPEGAVSLQSLLKNLIHTGSYTQKTNPGRYGQVQGVGNQSRSNLKANFTRDHSLSSNVSSLKSLSTSMRTGPSAKKTLTKKAAPSVKKEDAAAVHTPKP